MNKTKTIPTPTLEFEEALWQRGLLHVAGIDEAGRGALAGPVVASAVIVPPNASYAGIWADVRDSKLLSAEKRSCLSAAVKEHALAWGIGSASAHEIDQLNIAVATRLAMRRAVEALTSKPDYLLIDWVKLPTLNILQESYTKADQKIVSVAAASILAKTDRDQRLVELDKEYPAYKFASHKGYGTATHRAAIEAVGPCPIHRHTFAPIATKATLFDSAGNRKTGC